MHSISLHCWHNTLQKLKTEHISHPVTLCAGGCATVHSSALQCGTCTCCTAVCKFHISHTLHTLHLLHTLHTLHSVTGVLLEGVFVGKQAFPRLCQPPAHYSPAKVTTSSLTTKIHKICLKSKNCQIYLSLSSYDHNFCDDGDNDDEDYDDDDYQLKLMALDEAGYGSRTVKALYGFLSRLQIRSKASRS